MPEKTYQIKGKHSRNKMDEKDRSEYNKKELDLNINQDKKENIKKERKPRTTKEKTEKETDKKRTTKKEKANVETDKKRATKKEKTEVEPDKKRTTKKETEKIEIDKKETIKEAKEETESIIEKEENKKEKENKKENIIEEENKEEKNEETTEISNVSNKKELIKKQKEELDAIKQEIKTESKLPMEELKKVYKSSFIKALCGIMALFYFLMLNITFSKMNTDSYLRVLKVLSIVELAITIIIYEIAYKKESDKFALTGVEIMFLSISSLVAMYVLKNYITVFKYITTIMALIFSSYYMIKLIVMLIKQKKQIRMNIIEKNKEETR